jgi:hypothetical protein
MSDPNQPDPRDANTPHGGPAPDGGVPVPQPTPADQGSHQSPAFQQTPYPQSSHQGYPQSGQQAPNENPPGKTLGIVAIPVAVFFSVIGIILGFVAKSQSKKVGFKNTPATVAIIVGFVTLVLSIVATVLIFMALAAGLEATSQYIDEFCAQMGPGTHEVAGEEFTCQ